MASPADVARRKPAPLTARRGIVYTTSTPAPKK